MQIRSQTVNTRISFDLCPEIEAALKEKGILSKFEMQSKIDKTLNGNIAPEASVDEYKSLEYSFEKSKSLFEFEDNEVACNKTLNALSDTQLSDVVEPSGFWNTSLFENRQSPKLNQPNTQQSTIFEESGSTVHSFETPCESSNSSYFTATAKSGKIHTQSANYYINSLNISISVIDQKEPATLSDLDDSFIVLNDSTDQSVAFVSNTSDVSQPLQFNDTLEEIEFIMTKGKDYIQNVVEKVTFSTQNEQEVDKENMFKSKLPTPKSAKLKDKLQLPFKKPLASTSSLKKIDFNYIRSPIGEYIKNTVKSPMILSAKPGAITKQPTKLASDGSDSFRRYPSSIGTKNLPKKAYFSSETKKVRSFVISVNNILIDMLK